MEAHFGQEEVSLEAKFFNDEFELFIVLQGTAPFLLVDPVFVEGSL